jgi:hypothetical protein
LVIGHGRVEERMIDHPCEIEDSGVGHNPKLAERSFDSMAVSGFC